MLLADEFEISAWTLQSFDSMSSVPVYDIFDSDHFFLFRFIQFMAVLFIFETSADLSGADWFMLWIEYELKLK